MRLPGTLKWIGLALLGLMIAVAVAIAATSLVSQQIGIASESISAGDSLAPAIGSVGKGAPSQGGARDEPSEPTETTETTEPTETTEGGETKAAEPTAPADGQGSSGGDDGGGGSDD